MEPHGDRRQQGDDGHHQAETAARPLSAETIGQPACRNLHTHTHRLAAWRIVVSGVRRMNKVNARRARLVPGWVTVFGRVYNLGM